MNLHDLKPTKGATKKSKRIGRGEGSGKGGTATRGTKGAKSRAGYSHKTGFEGGQMPLQRRVPKFGFKNPNRIEFEPVNVSALQALAEKLGTGVLTPDLIVEAGLASGNSLIKVLGDGELTAQLQVTADKFSRTAVAKIEAAGGKAITEE